MPEDVAPKGVVYLSSASFTGRRRLARSKVKPSPRSAYGYSNCGVFTWSACITNSILRSANVYGRLLHLLDADQSLRLSRHFQGMITGRGP